MKKNKSMFDISRLEKLALLVEEEINTIIEKHTEELTKIIAEEMHETKIVSGMGVTYFRKNNEYIGVEFSEYLHKLFWKGFTCSFNDDTVKKALKQKYKKQTN